MSLDHTFADTCQDESGTKKLTYIQNHSWTNNTEHKNESCACHHLNICITTRLPSYNIPHRLMSTA